MEKTVKKIPSPMSNFETNCSELAKIEKQLESSQVSLEQSLALFERAQELIRECQSALNQAELRIKTIQNRQDIESG